MIRAGLGELRLDVLIQPDGESYRRRVRLMPSWWLVITQRTLDTTFGNGGFREVNFGDPAGTMAGMFSFSPTARSLW